MCEGSVGHVEGLAFGCVWRGCGIVEESMGCGCVEWGTCGVSDVCGGESGTCVERECGIWNL